MTGLLVALLLSATPASPPDAGVGLPDAGPVLPDIPFVDPESTPILCPGQSGPVHLRGQLPADAPVGVQDDAVSLSQAQRTADGWQATAQVKPDVLPATVFAQVAGRSVAILQIGCGYRFELTVANGDTLSVTASFARGSGSVPVTGVWKRGGKSLPASLTVQRSGKDELRFTRRVSTAEAQSSAQAVESMIDSPAMKRLDQESQTLIHALQTCGQKPAAEIQACMVGPQAQLQKVSDQRRALMERAESAHAPSMGCEELVLHARGTKLTGEAHSCVPAAGDAGTGAGADPQLAVQGLFSSQSAVKP